MVDRRVIRHIGDDAKLEVEESVLEDPRWKTWICKVVPDRIKIVVRPFEVEYDVRKRLCE
jgi:hypothetical protein